MQQRRQDHCLHRRPVVLEKVLTRLDRKDASTQAPRLPKSRAPTQKVTDYFVAPAPVWRIEERPSRGLSSRSSNLEYDPARETNAAVGWGFLHVLMRKKNATVWIMPSLPYSDVLFKARLMIWIAAYFGAGFTLLFLASAGAAVLHDHRKRIG
jgi:hypothetical protein